MNILLVEDDDQLLFILKESLERMETHYTVLGARSAREALRKSRRHSPALLITDLRLPGMDGVQLTKDLIEEHSDLIVIWITAHGCYTVEEEARTLGIYRCVDKPLKIEEIRRIARAALRCVAWSSDT